MTYDELTGLITTIAQNKNPEYGYSPVMPYNVLNVPATEPATAEVPDTSVTTNLQIQEATEKTIQGQPSFSSPIRSAQSIGGDATPPEGTTTGNPKDTGSWIDNPNATTAFQVAHYLSGTAQGMRAISAIANGYVSAGQYRMRANNLDFLARQNEHNAQSMLKNIREIDRAAQHDMSVLSEQNVKRKSQQRIAQAASGFAVGKGSYKVLADNTDWKTNFNASMIALKAGLQGAEVIRQAGGLEAQAIINRSEAEIARKNAKVARTNGWIAGIAGLAQTGASFYIGSVGSD